MLIWNFFFIVKVGLWLGGQLSFMPWWNAALFFSVVFLNLLGLRRPMWSLVLQLALALPLSVVLTLYEFDLVVSIALVEQIKQLLGFSKTYLLELVSRAVPPYLAWIGLLILASLQIFNRYVRVTAWVGFVLIGIGVTTTGQSLWADYTHPQQVAVDSPYVPTRFGAFEAEKLALSNQRFAHLKSFLEKQGENASTQPTDTPSGFLNSFFEKEKSRLASDASVLTPPDFDVIVLHVCSLSWADLRETKQTRHPLLDNADFLFSNFNAVSSYSGPATLRLLRSHCGQRPHQALYSPIQQECGLFFSLSKLGFEIQFGLNHDGRFDRFKQLVVENLSETATEPVKFNEVSLGAVAFDGSSLGRDSEILKKWSDQRDNNPQDAVAYYYNTITLHDGNMLPNSGLGSLESYPVRTKRLLNELSLFIEHLSTLDRKSLVLVIPEHGAGLSGAYGQLKGLRELPTPAITKVPVLGYWVSKDYEREDIYNYPIRIEYPTSYLAVTEFIERWVALPSPQRTQPDWPIITSSLPNTPFVAEQGKITVIEFQNKTLLKTPGNPWRPLQ